MVTASTASIELLQLIAKQLKPHGWKLRKAGCAGQWMLEHPTTKKKIRIWPGSGKWRVMLTDLAVGALNMPAGMPSGVGAESLLEHVAKMQA